MTSTSKAVRIQSLEGNRQSLDGGAMFGNAPRELWKSWHVPDHLGRIELACRSMLAIIDGQNVLFETGVGNYFPEALAMRYGIQNHSRFILGESLNKIGILEDQIQWVVLSHLHFDHAGGLLRPDGTLRFSKATYIVGRQAWERATQPHFRDRASFIQELPEALRLSGRLQVVDGNESLFQHQLTFRLSHGHTPGQLLSQVEGDKERVIFTGDLIPGSTWLHIPITMGYDRFAELVVDEKAELLEASDGKPTWLFFTHDPKWAMGKARKDIKGRFVVYDHVAETNHLLS